MKQNLIFTPGPWTVGPDFDNDGSPETTIVAMGGRATVAVVLEFGQNNPTMRAANARLISGTPEMYLALNTIMDALAYSQDSEALRAGLHRGYDLGRVALAKIHGQMA